MNSKTDRLKQNGIGFSTIIGITKDSDREIIHRYINRNLLKSHFSTVSYDELNKFIPLVYDEIRYYENPIYLLVNSDKEVIAFYKAPGFESDYLNYWVDSLIENK